MLRIRILLGTLMILVLAGLVVLDIRLSADMPNRPAAAQAAPLAPPSANHYWGLPTVAVAALLAFLAALEFGAILRNAGHRPIALWAAVISLGLIVLPWIQAALWPAPPTSLPIPMSTPIVPSTAPDVFTKCPEMPMTIWLTGGFIGTCLLTLSRRTTAGAITTIATTLLIIVFVGLLGSFLARIRCLAPGPAGAILVLYSVLTIKSCDIGAYLLGRIFGRTPLAPWLSPKKTVEGFIAGLLLACCVAVGGMAAWGVWGVDRLGAAPLGVAQAVIFGAVMAVIGHLGDLTESAFKRDVGTKDSGAVLPAFGGFLDILDSPWFAAPVAWWLLTYMGSMS